MGKRRMAYRERLKRRKPQTDDELWSYVRMHCGLTIPRHKIRHRPGCDEHNTPFELFADAFFDRVPGFLVWACRAGGKTENAGILTVLEAAHNSGMDCRILGGSERQSRHMYEVFCRLAEGPFNYAVRGDVQRELTRFRGGGQVEILTASPKSVLGHHVARVRLDEIDEFDSEVLQDVYGIAQSDINPDGSIRYPARIEAYSTFHHKYGPMSEEIARSKASGVPLYKWCIFEVLQRCPDERECRSCPLREDCRGVAKTDCSGYVTIFDAINWKRRHSKHAWDAFYLCTTPYVGGLFYREFEKALHVAAEPIPYRPRLPLYRAWDWGTKVPTVCLWAQVEKLRDGREVVSIIDELRIQGRAASDAADSFADHHVSQKYGRVVQDIGDVTGSVYIAEYRKVFRERGLNFNFQGRRPGKRQDKTSFRDECHEAVRKKLLSGTGEVSVAFSPIDRITNGTMQDGTLLQGTVPEMMGLHYPERRRGQAPTEDHVKVDDHGPDAFKYLCVVLFPSNEWQFAYAPRGRPLKLPAKLIGG